MRQKERGAVSLFVVVFAMLVITVITVSFLRLTVNDQELATNASLAEGARNSALAGVEDAKRALINYIDECNSGGDCAALEDTLTSDTCNAAVVDVVGSADVRNGEVLIQQSQNGSDQLLEQAYTCVTLDLNTIDYLGSAAPNKTQVIPLISENDFDTVTVEWFTRNDLSSDGSATQVNLPSTTNRDLDTSWPVNRPPLMGVQLMQFGDSFKLSDFDSVTDSGGTQSNANTVFLYPTSNGGTQSGFTARDQRRDGTDPAPADTSGDTPLGVRCQQNLSSGGYACSMQLTLPTPVGGGDRTAYLRLTPYYRATHYRVTMQNGANAVEFDGVQPEIDSTGRANNVFKRVSTRVDLYGSGLPYPSAAVDVTSNFCKDFSVTDDKYIAGSCTP